MIINGIDENEFKKGWWGMEDEGRELLSMLSLPTSRLPFNVSDYLSNGKINVSVKGKQWLLGYHRYDEMFEFSLLKNEKPKVIKLYREWDGEDLDMVIALESYAVGEYTRFILGGKIPRIDNI